MSEFYPILLVAGAVVGCSIAFIIAYIRLRRDKSAIGFDRTMSDGQITRRLLKYAKPHWRSFLLVLILMIFSISYSIISPLIVGAIEEMVVADFPISRLFAMVGVYVGILLISLFAGYVQSIVLQRTGQRIISELREDLFCHLERFSHAQFNAIPVGKLVTRLTNDTYAIAQMFTDIIVGLVQNCFVVIGVLIAMIALNYQLTLMVLCFAPFLVLFTVIFRKFTRKAYRKVKDGTTDINTFLSENLSGMKVIQIFNREERKRGEFEAKNRALGKAKQGQIFVFSIFHPLVFMLYISSILCMFYLGARGYIRGTSFLGQTITGATVVTFYMYISQFFNPIQRLAEQFNWLQSAFASAEKIFVFMNTEPELNDAPDAVPLPEVHGKIEFRHVWFAYVPNEWVLKDVSFTVEAGQTVAFVGSTGSGKSTILSLICRNYVPQRGQILIDGIDISTVTADSLRSQIGQMLQDVFLFSGTIRSNLVLRDETITDEEIRRVCHYVNADSFIDKLEQGVDEEVRERGNNFSAGQRQLISFARTLLHDPRILILDEATANIDTETEVLIQDSLEKMRTIGTMLIVAHRLSTVRNADNIIVLSHGQIVEQGDHESLMEQQGRYYRLHRLQEQAIRHESK